MKISCAFLSLLVVLVDTRVVFKKSRERHRQENYKNINIESFERRRIPVHKNISSVCSNKACRDVSKRIRLNIDWTTEPCDDFYRFACGNFIKTEQIPKDQSLVNVFSKANTALVKKLHKILRQPPEEGELRSFKMAKHMFNICMNEDLIESRGIGMVLDILKDAGGWPVLEGNKWDACNFDWVQTVFKLSDQYMTTDFFQMYITEDFIDPYKNVLSIGETDLDLGRELMVRGRGTEQMNAYADYIKDMMILFGAKNKTAVKDVADIIDFQIKLAKITSKREDQRDPRKIYNPMKINDLQAKFPLVDWSLYVKHYFKNSISLAPDEFIVVESPDYLKKLGKLLNNTKKRTMSNYLFWRAIDRTVPELTTALRDRKFQFIKIIKGVEQRQPRWKWCLYSSTRYFDLAISAMYIRTHFEKSSKTIVTDMVERVRKEMLDVLKRIDWMDEETRTKAIEKNQALQEHVAYPNELLDDGKLEEFYKKLDITGEQYLESKLKCKKFYWDEALRLFRHRINKTDWRTHGSIVKVNAYFQGAENSIQIPAGILQNLIFSPNLPQYMNYGTVGFTIGHEITHGFDDKGRYFDKIGSLVEWWKPETSDAFKKRAQCVIDQASSYRVESVNLTLNGINTQGENIADIGGAMLAMRAYNSWEADHGEEPRIIALEQFSPRQMFWLSSATFWCSKSRVQALFNRVMMDVHAPPDYRVFNFMRNQKAFAKDFNCPAGSKMNPKEKCNVWKID